MIEITILNPDGSKFIESPLIIPGEQLIGLDIESQFKIGSILEFAVTGNKLQGEVINCEPSTKDCHSASRSVGTESSSYTLQVVIKIKSKSPQIIPLTASTND